MSFHVAPKPLLLFLLLAALPLHPHTALAANGPGSTLPDAPLVSAWRPQSLGTPPPPFQAPRLAKYIQPGQQTLRLSAQDKLELAGWEQLHPFAFSTELLAAGWGQLLDLDPKYGSDSAGFGERLGAAALRQSSQAILADGVFPAILHQDPRFYRKGSGSIRSRIEYAASRVVITRTDNGNQAPNYSKLLGYAGALALTMTYYPAVSATWSNTAEGYFLSLATAAGMGNQLHEFAPDIVRLLLRRHRHARSTGKPSS